MKAAIILSISLFLSGCNAVSSLSSAGLSGCVIGGAGTYGGSCWATVSGSPVTTLVVWEDLRRMLPELCRIGALIETIMAGTLYRVTTK